MITGDDIYPTASVW